MTLSSRLIQCLALVVTSLAMTLTGTAQGAGQSFPNKPIRLVTAFPAGSAADINYRPVAEHMSRTLGQNVIIDPKPGGNGVISALYVRSQPGDGYTIYGVGIPTVVNSLIPGATYDLRKDFTAVAPSNTAPMLIVVNAEQVSARTLPELIEQARANPGRLNYASNGIGSGVNIFFELIKYETKINMVHIPYQGTAQAIADTAAGRTQVTGTALALARSHLAEYGGSGRLRLIAQSLSDRTKLVPGTPGMRESGFPNLDFGYWTGYVGPAGASKEAVDVLNRAINTALSDPKVLEIYEKQGLVATGGTPAMLEELIDREYARYRQLMNATGIKFD